MKRKEKERGIAKLKFSNLLFSASEWSSRILGTLLTIKASCL